jgi:hypothetical protein
MKCGNCLFPDPNKINDLGLAEEAFSQLTPFKKEAKSSFRKFLLPALLVAPNVAADARRTFATAPRITPQAARHVGKATCISAGAT